MCLFLPLVSHLFQCNNSTVNGPGIAPKGCVDTPFLLSDAILNTASVHSLISCLNLLIHTAYPGNIYLQPEGEVLEGCWLSCTNCCWCESTVVQIWYCLGQYTDFYYAAILPDKGDAKASIGKDQSFTYTTKSTANYYQVTSMLQESPDFSKLIMHYSSFLTFVLRHTSHLFK